MTQLELDRALRALRLSGMADVLDARLRHAQAERLPPLDLIAMLVNDELQRRQDRLLERRRVHARFRDPSRSLDSFDFSFNKKMNRALRNLSMKMRRSSEKFTKECERSRSDLPRG